MRFRFRLQGQLDGRDFTFDLEEGEFRVGSSSQSDLRLPLEGVSRRHALLRVLPRGVSLEDSGSRNGTWVDGRRIQKAAVVPGSEVGFGPAKLTLQSVDNSEAVAALLVQPPALQTSTGMSHLETPFLASDPRTGTPAILEHLETLLVLLQGPRGRAGALACLVEHLGAEGGWLVRWPERGQPAVLAACGAPPAFPDRPTLDQALEGQTAATLWRWDGGPSSPGPSSLGKPLDLQVLSEGDGHRVGLVLAAPDPAPWLATYCHLGLRLLLQPTTRLEPLDASRVDRPVRPSLRFADDYLPGTSEPMRTLYGEMEIALSTDLPLLMLGETGVGKERLIELFHRSSARAEGPLVALNGAAIAPELFEAELFGIVRGAATGVEARPGALRRAHGGTFFLDEVGELELPHQVKLLRALQEREVQPVGGSSPVPIDVRVVAATNLDLEARVAEGSFRSDLFYRLGGHVLRVPPLRERWADLPALIDFLTRKALEAHPAPVLGYSAQALRCLMQYPWPGNVRELKTEIDRLIAVCGRLGGRRLIDSALLPERLQRRDSVGETTPGLPESPPKVLETTGDLDLAQHVERLERSLIREALRRSDGQKAEAAHLLGLHRNGLRKKMQRLRIRVEDSS